MINTQLSIMGINGMNVYATGKHCCYDPAGVPSALFLDTEGALAGSVT
jgi:hypothetical protein